MNRITFFALIVAVVILPTALSAVSPYAEDFAPNIVNRQQPLYRAPLRTGMTFADSPAEAELLAPLETMDESPIDVQYVDLDITFYCPSTHYEGWTELDILVTTDMLSEMALHADPGLGIDSILVDRIPVTYTHGDWDTILIILPEPLAGRDVARVEFWFNGEYTDGYYAAPNMRGDSTNYTQSQPNDSRNWRPCHDVPWDKSTMRFTARVPEGLEAISNGVCTDTVTEGGWTAWTWETDHPIAPYLISVAIADYERIDHEYDFPLYTYAYTGTRDVVLAQWGYMADAMAIFEEAYGDYPFSDEKYAQSIVPDGYRAMEHQTTTHMGEGFLNYWNTVCAHELSHQWWGDELTCGTWKDIWLNEGWAVFSEFVYLEGITTYEDVRSYILNEHYGYIDGWEYRAFPIYDPDFMWGATVYNKGGSILDMLRTQMGQEMFWTAIRDYFETYRGGSAVTSEFIDIVDSYYGDSLDWFWDQWVYSAHTPEVAFGHYFRNRPDSTGYMIKIHQQDEPYYRMRMGYTIFDDLYTPIRSKLDILENDQVFAITLPADWNFAFEENNLALYKRVVDRYENLEPDWGDGEVTFTFMPPDDWMDITDDYLVLRQDNVAEFPGVFMEISDTIATIPVTETGFFRYLFMGRWAEDTSWFGFLGQTDWLPHPLDGQQLLVPTNAYHSIPADTRVEYYYVPVFQSDTVRGFDVQAITLSGNLKLYCARNRLPVWDGTTASGYEAAAEDGDTLVIEVTNSSLPIYTDFSIYYFMLVNEDGGRCFLRTHWLTTPDAIAETPRPAELNLTAFPNPFNSACQIDIPQGFTAAIFDIHGRHVHTLPTGSSIWNADGQASGVYLVRAQRGDAVVEKRVVLVK